MLLGKILAKVHLLRVQLVSLLVLKSESFQTENYVLFVIWIAYTLVCVRKPFPFLCTVSPSTLVCTFGFSDCPSAWHTQDTDKDCSLGITLLTLLLCVNKVSYFASYLKKELHGLSHELLQLKADRKSQRPATKEKKSMRWLNSLVVCLN